MVLENSKISIGRFNEVNKAQMEEDREAEEKIDKYHRVIKVIEIIAFFVVFVSSFYFLKPINTTIFSIIIIFLNFWGLAIFYIDAIPNFLIMKNFIVIAFAVGILKFVY